MQYNYIAVYNVVLIDQVYNNNIIIIIGDLYQLSFCKIHFGHNNSHFNNLSKHKIHLMYKQIMCTQIGNKDYIQVVFVSQVEN